MAITEIHVEVDLLPQVIRELLTFATIADDVQVTDGPNGRMLLVESGVADRWFEGHDKDQPAPPMDDEEEPSQEESIEEEPVQESTEEVATELEPVYREELPEFQPVYREEPPRTEPADQEEPVRRKRGRPRKITSATGSEDVL